ncbi:hypothetical protein KCU85_g3484, partial [Aureobasidium melanogenum]
MSGIHDLPIELLLQVFSYLDNYRDVRDCSQASATLRAIAYHPTLDHKLFRSENVKHKYDVIDMDTFVLHPMINETIFDRDMILEEDPYILTSDCEEEFGREHGSPVLRTGGHKNNDTSPPVSYLNFDGISIENKNNEAVTVGHVFRKLVSRNVRRRGDHRWWDLFDDHPCIWRVHWVDSGKVIEQHAEKHVKKALKDIVIRELGYS